MISPVGSIRRHMGWGILDIGSRKRHALHSKQRDLFSTRKSSRTYLNAMAWNVVVVVQGVGLNCGGASRRDPESSKMPYRDMKD